MNRTNIFYNASLKLTSLYLVIIMSISLIFSIGIYRVSSQELGKSIRRPESPAEQLIRQNNRGLHERLINEQNKELAEANNRLRANLVFINMFIFFAGGALSYYLARLTLKPIEEAHNAQSRFTADASHELRTPITAMRAETELTLTEPKLSLKQARDQLNSNMEELDKLTALSDGLLSLARLDNSDIETSREDLRKIISDAVERVKPLAENKKQLIRVQKSKKIIVQADKAALTDSLVTLLDNAVKYSPGGSEIQITTKSQSRCATITIKDQGVGIKASDLPHVFERFYRADQSRNKNKVNGYGIGLSIAKATIEAHGGEISATSELNNGSTFKIILPLR